MACKFFRKPVLASGNMRPVCQLLWSTWNENMRFGGPNGRETPVESRLMALDADLTPRAWTVSALCRAVADTLDARFNPVAVRGEVSGFSRAASGQCYFSL